MSKLRVIAAVLLAMLAAGGILFFLWWQLYQTPLFSGDVSVTKSVQSTFTTMFTDAAAVDPRDQALWNMHQGDQLALRGQWAEAQAAFELAVAADGGLPALRKLAQAQLVRRDLSGAAHTLQILQQKGARPKDLLLITLRIQLYSKRLDEARESLQSAEDSPQKDYGNVLLSILEGNHERAKAGLQAVMKGWDPVLRSYARTLQGAYDEFALFPESSDTHLVALLSRALAEVQECEIALPLLYQVTGRQSDYRDAWIVQGYCELVTERSDQAVASLQQAYRLDPQKPEIQYFLGRAYAARQDPANAITFLQYALINGFSAEKEVRNLIAQQALQQNNAALALEQYTAILALKDGADADLSVHQGAITAYMALGQMEKALAFARETVRTFPNQGRAYELLGWVALKLERKEEAKEALRKALEIDPYLSEAAAMLRQL